MCIELYALSTRYPDEDDWAFRMKVPWHSSPWLRDPNETTDGAKPGHKAPPGLYRAGIRRLASGQLDSAQVTYRHAIAITVLGSGNTTLILGDAVAGTSIHGWAAGKQRVEGSFAIAGQGR